MTHDPANPMPGVPMVESPFFEQLLAGLDASQEVRRVASDLHHRGLSVIEFPDPALDDRAERIVRDLTPRYDWEPWNERRESIRLMDEWRHHDDVRAIATNPEILDLLGRLYDRRPIPFQTLNFPVGTQQAHHSDCCHFHCVPERYMCGVWVALEDIDANNGPLSYYPGSNRWPVYSHQHLGSFAPGDQLLYEPMWRALVQLHGLQEEFAHLKRGQAVIWAANLLHGGARQLDTARTRHSQVTHYYFERCAYYMPHHSDPLNGAIEYKDLENIATGEIEPSTFHGQPIPSDHVARSIRGHAYCVERYDTQDELLPPGFDADAYLRAYPDVAAAGMTAGYHYKRFGRYEHRRT